MVVLFVMVCGFVVISVEMKAGGNEMDNYYEYYCGNQPRSFVLLLKELVGKYDRRICIYERGHDGKHSYEEVRE